ncbi:hypothetical protein [Paenarthrobacter sp. AMU7]|uniref:Uncharacterized protein n=1 Tax=Paenarthrobacter sp. AMU7 TaxID=3162492 RepID=A0AB39YVV6_9MICC
MGRAVRHPGAVHAAPVPVTPPGKDNTWVVLAPARVGTGAAVSHHNDVPSTVASSPSASTWSRCRDTSAPSRSFSMVPVR